MQTQCPKCRGKAFAVSNGKSVAENEEFQFGCANPMCNHKFGAKLSFVVNGPRAGVDSFGHDHKPSGDSQVDKDIY